ncbi:hypothetical protein [Sporosarcina sp. FSL K6-3457]|uniref:hypothetical protein n=1 Tax=Sporosarcina sp. FSL K6-3457 TaxID=2978204 RepID=UPI0030FC2936
MDSFKKVHGSTKLGIHRMTTDSKEWDSITKKDLFFKDILVIPDKNDFIRLAQADDALDTNYIIKKFSMQTK